METRIAAVVPAYREEAHIADVIETMPAFVDHIVIVDDCSPDDTSGVVRRLNNSRVHLIRHEENQGVGGAIITGHLAAIALGSDVNVVMAGDAQMDPDRLPELLEPVTTGGYGFAKANRFFAPESFSGMPRYRVFGNIVLSFMTKLASGYWHLFDPQNGYTATRTDVLRRVPLERVAKRYSFENDLLIHLNILQVPAVDVAVPALYGNEVSSIKLRQSRSRTLEPPDPGILAPDLVPLRAVVVLAHRTPALDGHWALFHWFRYRSLGLLPGRVIRRCDCRDGHARRAAPDDRHSDADQRAPARHPSQPVPTHPPADHPGAGGDLDVRMTSA